MSLEIHAAWLRALKNVLELGLESAPRGKKIRELLAQTVTFDGGRALLHHPRRGLNYRFAVAEWLWMAAGSDLVEPVARYNSNMAKFSDNGTTLAGAYGKRLAPQWWRVLEQLRRDPDTRQAVAMIWSPRETTVELTPPSKDVPCTLSAQFLLRGGRLHSVWSMRSNDLWLGLPYDAYSFARLTACVAGRLEVPTGTVTVVAGSQHLYEENLQAAADCLAERDSASSIATLDLPGFPPERLTDALLAGDGFPCDLEDPWNTYARALASKRSDEALVHLI